MQLIIFLIALLYVVCPADLAPGPIDDIIVAYLAFRVLL